MCSLHYGRAGRGRQSVPGEGARVEVFSDDLNSKTGVPAGGGSICGGLLFECCFQRTIVGLCTVKSVKPGLLLSWKPGLDQDMARQIPKDW